MGGEKHVLFADGDVELSLQKTIEGDNLLVYRDEELTSYADFTDEWLPFGDWTHIALTAGTNASDVFEHKLYLNGAPLSLDSTATTEVASNSVMATIGRA